jgi:Flp pilus assembly protein TadG
MRFRDDTSGAAVVEAAFLFPLLIAMGFGFIDGSMLLLQNHKVEQGLVAGAGYLARANTPAAVERLAQNYAVTGTIDGTGQARVSGWQPSDVRVTISTIANNGDYRGSADVKIARFSTAHSYQGLGFIKLVSGGRVTIRANHEERLVRAL